MGFDVHRVGTYLVTSPADNRLPYRFDWSWPKMTAGYRAHLQAGLKPETYADELWELSQHMLTVGWYDLDTADLVAAINEAVLAITPTQRWYVTAAGTSETYSCLIRDVEHSEAYSVDVDGRRGTAIDFTLTCTAGWEAEEIEAETLPETVPPGTTLYVAKGLLGSMPAPFRLVLTNDQAVTGGTFGFRHSPISGFNTVQDYQGTSDSTALGGQCASATMDADGNQVGTPMALDSNVMRGWYYACARLKQTNEVPLFTEYSALSTVSGSGMTGTQQIASDKVWASGVIGTWEHVRLGPVPIPAGSVPRAETGSGYGPEAQIVSSVPTAGAFFTAEQLGEADAELLLVGARFSWSGGMLTRIRPKLKNNTASQVQATATIRHFDAATSSVGYEIARKTVTLASGHDGSVDFTFDIVIPADDYVYTVDADGVTLAHYYEYSTYSENVVAYVGAYTTTAAHEYYEEWRTGYLGRLSYYIYRSLPLSFQSSVAIIAANPVDDGGVFLDTVGLVPADEFAVLFDTTHAAAEGVMVDAMDPDEVTVYAANRNNGVAPVDQAKVEYAGIPRIWPGDTGIVYDPHTPGNAAPLATAARLWYRPTYRTPYGA